METDDNWRARGNCRDKDPEMFFAGQGGDALAITAQAKRICRHCDVRAECLDWALRTNQEIGVWGGLSERERRKLQAGVPRTLVGSM